MSVSFGASSDRPIQPIGRYELTKVIGTGAFATVYEAHDEQLDAIVAIKVLAENHSFDAGLRERFLTEGRVLRRIDSPYVLQVYDLGETQEGQPYLVLEHANRGTLAQRAQTLRGGGWQPSPADVWAVAEPLAAALSAIHRADVIHRDLNPSNVLLTTRGLPLGGQRTEAAHEAAVVLCDERLLVADLGLCKDLAFNSGITVAGGTEGFRPPELRGGPSVISPTADLWSLSALIMWLITGTPPVSGASRLAVVETGLPEALAAALDQSLAEDPNARHRHPQAWLDAVRAGLMPPPPAPPSPPIPSGPSSGLAASDVTPTAEPVPIPPQQPVTYPTSMPHTVRPLRWTLQHSLWLLTNLGFSFTTWCGFLYIGLRAQRRAWLWSAGLYAAGLIVWLTMLVAAPTDANGQAEQGWLFWGSLLVFLAVCIGGTIHGFIANADWLRWLASQRPHRSSDQPHGAAHAASSQLQEPWVSFVYSAESSYARAYQAFDRTAATSPLRESLSQMAWQIAALVEACWRAAQHGQTLAQTRERIDSARLEDAITTMERAATGPVDPVAAQTLTSLRAQRDGAARLDRAIESTLANLRMLDARLGETVLVMAEISLDAGAGGAPTEVVSSVNQVLADMHALREAMNETRSIGLPGGLLRIDG